MTIKYIMHKKQYSLVQVNFKQGPTSLNSYHLPYSAGLLAAYSMSIPDIKTQWSLDKLIWQREPIEDLAQHLQTNQVVGLSTYVWNREYNYTLAKRIKELNDKCLIVLGGPEPPNSDPGVFKKFPWIDIIVKNEGELAWASILENYESNNFNFPGLVVNRSTEAIDTGVSQRIQDINTVPSPYLTGLFDDIIDKNPNISWSSTLETNRGCPYACTFCDTGLEIYNKVKTFDLDRVLEEIEWMGQKCGYISVADPNFGIFVDRDKIVLEKLIEVQKKYKVVDNIGITWAKNKKPEILSMMKDYNLKAPASGQGLTLSVQDMDESVLDIIKRKNLNQHHLIDLFDWCEKNNIPFYSELILGLPEQTLESWKNNFWKLFEAGNHNGINIHQCEIIENTELNKFQKSLYKINTFKVSDYFAGSTDCLDINEYTNVVLSTRSFSDSDMLDAWVWNGFIQTFHINGVTSIISRYLRRRHNISYQQFYDNLYLFLLDNQWFSDQININKNLYRQWITNGKTDTAAIAGVYIPGWNLHNRLTMALHAEKKLLDIYCYIKNFLNLYKIDHVDQLISFQKDCVLDFSLLNQYPIKKTAPLNFADFIKNGNPLEQQVTYTVDTKENKNMDFQTFLENFYFGRKRLFGSTLIQIK